MFNKKIYFKSLAFLLGQTSYVCMNYMQLLIIRTYDWPVRTGQM